MKIIKIKWIMQLQLFHHHHREKYILILVGLLDWSVLYHIDNEFKSRLLSL